MTIFSIPGFSDPFSSISHFLGAIFFLVYGIKLIKLSRQNISHLLTTIVFVFSAVFLLSMSSIYHLLEHQSTARDVLQRLDHAGIFALIAGTFTPVHGVLFKGFWRWGMVCIIWLLAITGITLKSIFFHEMAEWFGLMLYLGLGWVGILSAFLTHRLHGFAVIRPLIYGALAYTVGASLEFLQLPIVIPGVLGPHELFHVAVLMGIGWHWLFIRNLLLLKSTDKNTGSTQAG
ncbi:MAG: hemolysin III family protein [Gammaproteobacteria bacterium]|nr:hemolysin III family protein [Gammaproteobacteria bacterium]